MIKRIYPKILHKLKSQREGDIISDYAMPLSAEALKIVTGLINMDFNEMNRVSQGLIDGIANYKGDKKIEAVYWRSYMGKEMRWMGVLLIILIAGYFINSFQPVSYTHLTLPTKRIV